MGRMLRRYSILAAIAVSAALGWTLPANATPSCASFDGQSVTALAGVTCDIGTYQYSFGTANDASETINSGGSVIAETNGPPLSNFIFNAVIDGFSLSYEGGLSITAATAGQGTQLGFQLNYGVTDLDGVFISANATGGVLASTQTTTGTGTNTDDAEYNNLVCDTSNCGGNLLQGAAQSLNGVNSSYQRTQGNPTFTPFSVSGLNDFEATIELQDFYRGTASWDGSATDFTIGSMVPTTVAEPDSNLLFAGGLAASLLLMRRRRSGLVA